MRLSVFLLLSTVCVPIFAQPYPKTLYGFGKQNAPKIRGLNPDSTLVETSPGVFYGTTASGGIAGCGTLFKITTAGAFTKLHDFVPKGPASLQVAWSKLATVISMAQRSAAFYLPEILLYSVATLPAT